MPKRTPGRQSKHDNGVQKTADYYHDLGYKVDADINGFDKPKTLKGKRPDVIAKKKSDTVIVEHETPDSLKKDAKQRQVFKDYADTHKGVRFRTKLVK
ncbi:hypothetical protein HQ544_01070 [Candidatus Falkowbacteria bacterium]|nr:hypothetical protein [Candidatus Falkowbacteria bacterium]